MKKSIYAILALMILAIFIAGCTEKEVKTETKEPIKIGMLTPLTGDAAVWGVEIKKGAELAYDSFKDEQINGRPIQIIYEDDKCDAKEGVSVITKLINIDGVKLTGGTACSSVALSIAPINEENKVIHISAGATNPALTAAGDYMFRVYASDDFEGKTIADYAIDVLEIQNVGIIYINNDYGLGLKTAFNNEFTKNGGTIIAEENFAPSSTDFKTQLSKIKAKNPDAIYIVSNPQEIVRLLNQVSELGITQTLLVNGPAIEAVGLSTITTVDGIYYAQAETHESPGFKSAFVDKFGTEPNFLPNLGYDVTMLLYDAIKSCDGDDTSCVKDYLYSVKEYNGASAIITFDENGDVEVPFVVKKIENGQAIVVN